MKFQPSHLHLKSKKNPFLFTADFRPGNRIIVDAIIKFKYSGTSLSKNILTNGIIVIKPVISIIPIKHTEARYK